MRGLPMTPPPETPGPWRAILFYLVMIAAVVGLFLAIRGHGETLTAPPSDEGSAGKVESASSGGGAIQHVLLALAAVILTGYALGRVFAYIGQPPVIGEVVAGILLGPSLLGRETSAHILPPSVAPYLGVIAQLGVILYMFLIGLELNLSRLRGRAQATVTIAHTGIVVPFLLGAGLALWLYPRYSHASVPFTSFALFIGVALSITAFPVLARILSDRRMTRSDLGVFSLGCAAVGDVTAWCLLAFVVGMAQAKVGGAVAVAGLALAFIAFIFLIVRPTAGYFVRRMGDRPLSTGTITLVFTGVLLSALATEKIGIHAVFGAFLLGAVIPHDSAIAREFTHKLENVVSVLLLPAFFAYVGMRTEIGLLAGWTNWLVCGVIILTATAGKWGGTVVAGRLTGLDWRTSASLGVLMNTRGLMELIVLNIGLDLGVISPTVFAMMVIMALATTVATTPLLIMLERKDGSESRGLEEAKAGELMAQ
jgi:Kef-type K+ transport system membrane component KefB